MDSALGSCKRFQSICILIQVTLIDNDVCLLQVKLIDYIYDVFKLCYRWHWLTMCVYVTGDIDWQWYWCVYVTGDIDWHWYWCVYVAGDIDWQWYWCVYVTGDIDWLYNYDVWMLQVTLIDYIIMMCECYKWHWLTI